MLEVLDFTHDNIIATKVSGEVKGKDYEKVQPYVDDIAEKGQKIRWYFELQNKEGWNADAIVEDIKVDLKHANDYEKVAIVGAKDWEESLAKAFEPFTKAEVQYYELAEKEKAKEWINL
ncbi:STAS/SEC14 domain-containing protein [Porifericola rhodea]|uniref:STAS/SEC14 domain-containing protein n=1 Tax=Porifericola rhodea TaxID=930972 RepID=UPI002665C6FF|nr:STAS/SEC14 domain-containing protein [Porifericola rhodea]WKN32184.1 STAS/SEC14 domain-containing protein [Porifericola rhodea]